MLQRLRITLAQINTGNTSDNLLKSSDRDLKSCQVMASDKSNLLRKVDFLLKNGLQVINFLFLWRYSFELCLQIRTTNIFGTSKNNVWLVYIFGIRFQLLV